jgi:HEPN domain-containing protein
MKVKNKKQALEWFARAESDFQYAKAGEKATGHHHITCFLCHQVVEKLLKSLVVAAGHLPQKTHSVRGLHGTASSLYPRLTGLKIALEDMRKLDSFYIPSRYPGPIAEDFRAADAKEALRISEEMIAIVRLVYQ